jgi:hypothetical protein
MMDDPMDRTIDEAAADYHRPPEAPREEMWRRIEAARRETAGDGRGRQGTAGAGSEGVRVLPFRRRVLRVGVPVGIAALLALAFGLGRVSVDEPGTPAAPIAAERPDPVPPTLADAEPQADVPPVLELATEEPSQVVARSPRRARPSEPSRSEPSAPQGGELPVAGDAAPASSDALALAAREHLAQAESFLVLFRASINAGQRVEPVVPATARYLLASNRLLIDSPAASDPGMRRLLSDVELVLAQIAQMPADEADSTDERLITDGIEQRDLLIRIRTAAGNARGMPNQGVI